jgi:peptidoglycan hydrolase CwlO-like protein
VTYNSTNVTLTYTAWDMNNVTACQYELNGNANISIANCANTTFIADILGSNIIKVWANDTFNNWNSSSISFTARYPYYNRSEIDSLIAALNTSINNLDTTMGLIQANVTTLQSDVTSINSTLTALDTTVGLINTNVTYLQNNVTYIYSLIASNDTLLNNKIDAVNASLTTLMSNVSVLGSNVTTLFANITTLAGRLDVVEANITTIFANITAINTQIRNLWAAIYVLQVPYVTWSWPYYQTFTSTSVSINVTTDKNSGCNYDVRDVEFGNMTYNMTGSSTTHNATVTAAEDLNVYYIRCESNSGNTAGVAMKESKIVIFSVDTTGNYNYIQKLNANWNTLWIPPTAILATYGYNTSDVTVINISTFLSTTAGLGTNYNLVYYNINNTDSGWKYFERGNWNVSNLKYINNTNAYPYWINMTTSDRFEI